MIFNTTCDILSGLDLYPTNTMNNDDSFTKETNFIIANIIHILISCALIHICAVVGAFGNIATLIILFRSRYKETSNIMLLSMAACDLFYLINLSSRKLDCIIERFDPSFAEVYQYHVVAYVRMPGRISIFISLTHVLIISYERLVVVFYPLKVSILITRTRIVIILVITYISCIVLELPWTVSRYEVHWEFSTNLNRTVPILKETEWFIKNKKNLDIASDVAINNINFLSSILVAVNCSAIAYKLHLVSKQRQLLTSAKGEGRRNDVKVSRMLLIVCAVFCLCSLSSFAIYFYFYLDSSMRPPSKWFALLCDLDEFILAVNSTANFFIYVLMSNKFYNSVISLLRCRPCC
jgi:hypothetical protein